MKKQYIAIVDPFVDVKRLTEAFSERGVQCVAILSKAASLEDMKEMLRLKR